MRRTGSHQQRAFQEGGSISHVESLVCPLDLTTCMSSITWTEGPKSGDGKRDEEDAFSDLSALNGC